MVMRDVVLASFLNPESILEKGGLALLALIIFAETGLLIGFFLPGDPLGFWFGRKVGPSLFSRPDSRFFKQQNVAKAHAFFERHGAKTIVLARFVPIVRTFAPIVAGVSDMNYRTFVVFNVIGGFIWAIGLTTLGYYMGQIDVVKNDIEIAIVVIVALSLIPVAVEFVKHRREAKRLTDDAMADVTE